MPAAVTHLLNDVSGRLEALAETRRHLAPQMAPDFSIFRFMRSDEYGLSAVLADLLNPEGTHGQGPVFLDAFIAMTGSCAPWASGPHAWHVTTEERANDRRRIDIHLASAGGLIGIENKPWAPDGNLQLSDYADYLAGMAAGRKWLLVYLCNNDPDPLSISTEKRQTLAAQGNFLRVDYTQLTSWLTRCTNLAQALAVRVLIEQTASFVRKNINMEQDMTTEKEIAAAVLESAQSFTAALHIAKTMVVAKSDLLQRLRADLDRELTVSGMALADWGLDSPNAPRFRGWNITFPEAVEPITLRFQFEWASLRKFFWGIYCKPPEAVDPRLATHIRLMMDEHIYKGRKDGPWIWYSDLPDPEFGPAMVDWSVSEDPWLAIQDGSLAPKIAQIAQRTRAAWASQGSRTLNTTSEP